MGTPDLLGTYGTFSFFTSEPFAFGGQVALRRHRACRWTSTSGVVRASLEGPDNPFLVEAGEDHAPSSSATSTPAASTSKLVVGSEERLLKVGEWSDWVPVELHAGAVADAARARRASI